ncbi:hypothetical protein [Endozoicomonas ascidiicola]|uniref:baseplate complex protein n=1 Tax=Endozoicomonas ascidiicola TaxID=1698521 RepID=UPI000835FB76|nr:hypothetical protein [Endozoicomonas ascidiicola]
MILLNQQKVPGHGVKVRASFRLEDKDLSGTSSATDTAEGGIKPQSLSVSLSIKYTDDSDLTRLLAMARAIDTQTGKRQVYKITNGTAQAGNIRKVKFTENFSYVENATLRMWDVSFTLRECESVPEKIEQRQAQPAATEQSAEGDTITSDEPAPDTITAVANAAGGSVQEMMKRFEATLGR